MRPVRIFRHVVCEGPGYLGRFLEREGVAWELVCLDDGIAVPMSVDDISGLVFLGGNMSVNDPLDWIGQELELIRLAHGLGMPMLGVCFGGQLISKALGGEVGANPNGMEVGWHSVRRVKDCDCGGWLEGLPNAIHTFHWHGESFTPPPGGRPLLENRCFHNQAFALGDSLAMQFHLEMTEEMVREWLEEYWRKLKLDSRCIQDSAAITHGLPDKITRLNRVADVIFGHWLRRIRRRSGT